MTGDASDPEQLQAVFDRICQRSGQCLMSSAANAALPGPTALVEDSCGFEEFRRPASPVNLGKCVSPPPNSGRLRFDCEDAEIGPFDPDHVLEMRAINGFPNRFTLCTAKNGAEIGLHLKDTRHGAPVPYGIRANAIASQVVLKDTRSMVFDRA